MIKRNSINRSISTRDLRALRLLKVITLMLLVAMTTPVYADTDTPYPLKSKTAPEIRLIDKTVTLPIVMVREFPFIEGSVAGVSGKLMLDTGIEQAITINDHRVPVLHGRKIGQGFFESGQTFAVRLVSELGDIRIGGLFYPRATDVIVQDARLLEKITPDFIGWLGYHAFATHALKLDYGKLRATFYKNGAADYLKGERVVAELPFETRKLPNHPIMAGRIGEMAIVTTWDTGQHGSLYTSEEGKARLLKEGRLIPSRTKRDAFDLNGLQLNGHTMPVVQGIDIETEPSPAAKPVGIVEPHELTIGYGLIHQFKTVWDFQQRRVYLLTR